jgi:hypothetical protein
LVYSFYLIESGILRAVYRFASAPPAVHVVQESMLPGTVSGELTFLSAGRRNATVVAERDSVLWRLRRERWNELEKDEPDAAREATRILIRIANEEMDVLIVRPPPPLLFRLGLVVALTRLFFPPRVSTGQFVYDSVNGNREQKRQRGV